MFFLGGALEMKYWKKKNIQQRNHFKTLFQRKTNIYVGHAFFPMKTGTERWVVGGLVGGGARNSISFKNILKALIE